MKESRNLTVSFVAVSVVLVGLLSAFPSVYEGKKKKERPNYVGNLGGSTNYASSEEQVDRRSFQQPRSSSRRQPVELVETAENGSCGRVLRGGRSVCVR